MFGGQQPERRENWKMRQESRQNRWDEELNAQQNRENG